VFTIDDAPPREPGTYVLWFDIAAPITLSELKSQPASLLPGSYVYVGSALGPGGLQARVQRHMRLDRAPGRVRRHWHVDTLTDLCRPNFLGYDVSPARQECRWAQILQAAGACWAIAGFGSSDCRQGCRAHLLTVPVSWSQETLKGLLT
jgi:Uri superfamily endonuclease